MKGALLVLYSICKDYADIHGTDILLKTKALWSMHASRLVAGSDVLVDHEITIDELRSNSDNLAEDKEFITYLSSNSSKLT